MFKMAGLNQLSLLFDRINSLSIAILDNWMFGYGTQNLFNRIQTCGTTTNILTLKEKRSEKEKTNFTKFEKYNEKKNKKKKTIKNVIVINNLKFQ